MKFNTTSLCFIILLIAILTSCNYGKQSFISYTNKTLSCFTKKSLGVNDLYLVLDINQNNSLQENLYLCLENKFTDVCKINNIEYADNRSDKEKIEYYYLNGSTNIYNSYYYNFKYRELFDYSIDFLTALDSFSQLNYYNKKFHDGEFCTNVCIYDNNGNKCSYYNLYIQKNGKLILYSKFFNGEPNIIGLDYAKLEKILDSFYINTSID